MVTNDSFRQFALDCGRWAERATDPSHRQTMLNLAHMWMNVALTLDRAVADGTELALPDLRTKLD
jgi:hypothetical protein